MSIHEQENPPENPHPQPRPRAANAVKHGFRSSKYLDPAILAAAETIRADLVSIHEPDSEEENDVIEDLAIARARFDAVQRSFDSDHAHNRKNARAAFEDQVRKRLDHDLDELPKSPLFNFEPIGQYHEGVRWIVGRWSEVVQSLGPDRPGMTFDLAIFACFALGSTWKIPRMNATGAWVMARFVRQSLEPKVELQRWVELTAGPTDESLARWYLDRSPNPATCRQELLTRAKSELDRWTLRLNELQADFETEAAEAADRILPGMPVGNDQPDRLRIPIRYLSEARGQVDRLQRRLDALKKSRPMNRHRAERKAEREARRHLRESADSSTAQPEPPQRPPQGESTEATRFAYVAHIPANEFLAPGQLPLAVDAALPTAYPSFIPSSATVHACAERLSDAAPLTADTMRSAAMPSADSVPFSVDDSDHSEIVIETHHQFDFEGDPSAILEIDADAEAAARTQAGDASEAPSPNQSQKSASRKDTPISANTASPFPTPGHQLIDGVSAPRVPRDRRIGRLAERLGVRFETGAADDTEADEEEVDDDLTVPPMTPDDDHASEDWKSRLPRWRRGMDPQP